MPHSRKWPRRHHRNHANFSVLRFIVILFSLISLLSRIIYSIYGTWLTFTTFDCIPCENSTNNLTSGLFTSKHSSFQLNSKRGLNLKPIINETKSRTRRANNDTNIFSHDYSLNSDYEETRDQAQSLAKEAFQKITLEWSMIFNDTNSDDTNSDDINSDDTNSHLDNNYDYIYPQNNNQNNDFINFTSKEKNTSADENKMEKLLDHKMMEGVVDNNKTVEKLMDNNKMVEKLMDNNKMMEKLMDHIREDKSLNQPQFEKFRIHLNEFDDNIKVNVSNALSRLFGVTNQKSNSFDPKKLKKKQFYDQESESSDSINFIKDKEPHFDNKTFNSFNISAQEKHAPKNGSGKELGILTESYFSSNNNMSEGIKVNSSSGNPMNHELGENLNKVKKSNKILGTTNSSIKNDENINKCSDECGLFLTLELNDPKSRKWTMILITCVLYLYALIMLCIFLGACLSSIDLLIISTFVEGAKLFAAFVLLIIDNFNGRKVEFNLINFKIDVDSNGNGWAADFSYSEYLLDLIIFGSSTLLAVKTLKKASNKNIRILPCDDPRIHGTYNYRNSVQRNSAQRNIINSVDT